MYREHRAVIFAIAQLSCANKVFKPLDRHCVVLLYELYMGPRFLKPCKLGIFGGGGETDVNYNGRFTNTQSG